MRMDPSIIMIYTSVHQLVWPSLLQPYWVDWGSMYIAMS